MKKSDLKDIIVNLKLIEKDIKSRSIPYKNGKIEIFFISQLIDTNALAEYVIKPLINHCSDADQSVSPQKAADSIICVTDVKTETDFLKIEETILSGMVVVLFSTDSKYLVLNLRKVESRAIPEQIGRAHV